VIDWVVVVWSALALVMAAVSLMTLGRKLGELEWLYAQKRNGISRIQAWQNVRTHGNRVLAGLVFLLVGLLTMMPVPTEVRMLVARVGFIAVIVLFTASSVLDWFDDRRLLRLQIEADERRGGGIQRHGADA
jgi:hypothetical protein